MPVIRITSAGHQDQAVKDAVIKDVTAAYAAASKSDPAKVWVVLEEIERSDFGVAGVSLAANKPA